MWSKIAIQVAKYLATTEQGHKISKWLLLGVICFFVLVPVIAFAPISGFVTGVSSFFSGEEGDDLNDAADLDALLNDNFNITETKYYRQIEKARTRHINEVSKEQEARAKEVREENKYTVTYTDSKGHSHTRTVYPVVETPQPEPPVISVLAYFCTTKEVQLADPNQKLSVADVKEFYQKICKRPFKVERINKDLYIVTVEYMSDNEIAKMLLVERVFEDEGDEDLFRVSIERLTELFQVSGKWGYNGVPSGNLSNIAVAEQIWNFFKGKGWSDYACAALIGNFEAECSLRPNLQETGGTGIGLGQWSHGRRTKFLNWLHSNGKDIGDIAAQCEYILVENIWYSGNVKLYNGGGIRHQSKANSLSEFGTYGYQQTTDAVDDFLWHWESPNYKKAQLDRRQGAALDAYNMFAGGRKPRVNGSYAQIKQSFFPGGRLPQNASEMNPYLTDISFINSAGIRKHITVHKSVAADLVEALNEISAGGYEIKEIGGYVWKTKTNSNSGDRSSHSYGLAIDINPNYGNPQVKNGKRLVGALDYGSHALSMKNGDIAVRTMSAYGWKWGGNWTSSKDYMHFSVPGD